MTQDSRPVKTVMHKNVLELILPGTSECCTKLFTVKRLQRICSILYNSHINVILGEHSVKNISFFHDYFKGIVMAVFEYFHLLEVLGLHGLMLQLRACIHKD